MRFFHPNARLPKRPELLAAVESAAERVHDRLLALDIDRIGLSEYNQRRLGESLGDLQVRLMVYTHLLVRSLAPLNKPLEEATLLEYGGGPGLLSLLAREMGIGTVLYNDPYEVSCRDARLTAGALGLEAEAYIPGEVDETLEALRGSGVSCDVVASNNVIEHVYDARAFLHAMRRFSDGPLVVTHATTANPLNPRVRWVTMKIHREREFHDRERAWGRKETGTHRSYLQLRREMIRQAAPDLDEETVRRLARLTRGLRRDDILAAVERHRRTREWPTPPKHPTNTCDPFTGSWAERLTRPAELTDWLGQAGFRASILPGYYSCARHPWKPRLCGFANRAIALSGRLGMVLAPYFLLHGVRGLEKGS